MERNFILILIILFSGTGFAQTCCSGGVPLSNNVGIPNEGKGVLVVGISYDYNNLNTLNFRTENLEDDSRERITHSGLLNLGYGFTDRFSVEALFSWVNQSRTISQFGNVDFTETAGIGDAVFLAKYAVPDLLGEFSLVNLGLGTKAPLGASDIVTDQGVQLTADLQPGSGAWDGIGWLAISKGLNIRPSAIVFGSATYRFTGTNDDYLDNRATYEFGNEFLTNIGYIDQVVMFNTLVNPGLIVKYRHAGGDKINESKVPNTGGEWIFVRPEVSVLLWQNVYFNTGVELPVYSYVEGTQLTPTFRIGVGLTFIIGTRKTDSLNFPL